MTKKQNLTMAVAVAVKKTVNMNHYQAKPEGFRKVQGKPGN